MGGPLVGIALSLAAGKTTGGCGTLVEPVVE
jgi:hypothetical protein